MTRKQICRVHCACIGQNMSGTITAIMYMLSVHTTEAVSMIVVGRVGNMHRAVAKTWPHAVDI